MQNEDDNYYREQYMSRDELYTWRERQNIQTNTYFYINPFFTKRHTTLCGKDLEGYLCSFIPGVQHNGVQANFFENYGYDSKFNSGLVIRARNSDINPGSFMSKTHFDSTLPDYLAQQYNYSDDSNFVNYGLNHWGNKLNCRQTSVESEADGCLLYTSPSPRD